MRNIFQFISSKNYSSKEEPQNINHQDSKGRTALMIAARNNSTEDLEEILEFKPHLELFDYKGHTALSYAVSKNFTESSKSLMVAGSNLNHSDLSGLTPIFHSLLKQNLEIFTALLENGANVNAKLPKLEYSPLIMAIANSDVAFADILINHPEIDLNLQDHAGATALIWAVNSNQINIVGKLLIAGADMEITDSDGMNAIDYAESEIYEMLLQHQIIPESVDVTSDEMLIAGADSEFMTHDEVIL